MEKHAKRTIVIALFLLTAVFAVFVVFSSTKTAQALRDGVKMSLEEDFKIKESLGKVFFVQNKDDSQEVSGTVNVVRFAAPATGRCESLNDGEPFFRYENGRYNGIYAVNDGIIESCENEKITIRHKDGKLSVYYGCTALVKKGSSVKKGEVIGYSGETMEYKLYQNCVALDPAIYIDEN